MTDEVKTEDKSKTESVPLKQTTKSRTMRSEHKRVKKAFESSSQLFQALVQNALDAIVVISPALTVRYESPSMERLTGRSSNSRIGKNPLEFCHPDDTEKVTNEFIRLFENKIAHVNIEVRLQHKDGRWLIFELVGTNLIDDPVVKGIVLNLRDISKRKHIEDQYRALVEKMNDGLAVLGKDGLHTYVNDKYCEMTGYSNAELMGRSPLELMDEDNRDIFSREIVKRRKGKSDPYELEFIKKDGSRFTANISPQIVTDSAGENIGAFAVITDITRLKEVKEALLKSEQNLKYAQEMAHLGYWEWDSSTNEVVLSEEMQRILGYDQVKAKFSGRPKIIHPDDLVKLQEAIAAVQNGGDPRVEFRLVLPTGDMKWIQAGATHIDKDSDQSGKVFGYALDITEQKHAEEKIRESEDKIRAIFNNVGVGITVLDAEGNIVDVNETVLRMKGYNREDVIGHFGLNFVAERDRTRATNDMMDFLMAQADRTPMREYTLLAKDGSEIPCEACSTLLHDSSGNLVGFVSVEMAITERKRAEEMLKESEERLRAFMESSTDIYAIFDSQLRLMEISDRGVKAFLPDKTREEQIGKHIAEIVPEVMETGRYEEYLKVIETGKPFQVDEIIMHPRFASRYISIKAFKVQEGMGMIFSDITGRKNAEQELRYYSERLRAMAKQLSEVEESQRRRTARELHDNVGQNLTVLGINWNMAKTQLEKSRVEEVKTILDDSQELVEQTTEAIRDIMADLRPPVLEDYGLLAALRWYGERFASRTGIVTTVQGEEPDTRMSADIEITLFRIAQEALTNVAKHANASAVIVNFNRKDGRQRLLIADDGIGFDKDELSKYAEQANWGLVIMTERADSIGASFEIESTPGIGTRVIVEKLSSC